MPDDSSRRRGRDQGGGEEATGGILPDPIDLRDRHYEPTLRRLSPALLPDPEVVAAFARWGLPRVQGDEGTCGGQALAALIDLERIRPDDEPRPASARMIYQMALLKNDGGGTGVSLRDVIKSLYNYGVCSDREWPYEPSPADPGALTVARAKEAKETTLGAYYRLRPNLNTYHSALNETGAVVVSAALHDGWLHDAVKKNDGRIVAPERPDPRSPLADEKHAFVVVGYTPDGFLVLNSWGPTWGNWRPEDSEPGKPIPGVALWPYEDWADNVMDGWVLRLGAAGVRAFAYSIGDMGLGFGPDMAVRSTPVHAILGNFLHLDDGDFVRKGAYVSTETTLKETKAHLLADATEPKKEGEAPYKGVLLTFAGALQTLKEAADHVLRWKRLVQTAGWYPFTVFWCVDNVEPMRALLDDVFREAEALAGKPGEQLDRMIEERVHGVGRALWRDIDHAAVRSTRENGPLHALAGAWAGLAAARPELRLRVVAESEGAFALKALAAAMRGPAFAAEAGAFFERLDSVDLVVPPIGGADYRTLARDLDDGWTAARRRKPGIRVHVPTGRHEKRLAVPPYGCSWMELVRLGFHGRAGTPQDGAEEGHREPEPIVCASTARFAIARKWPAWTGDAPRTALVPVVFAEEPDPAGQIRQTQLIYRSDVGGRLRAILGVADAPVRGIPAIA